MIIYRKTNTVTALMLLASYTASHALNTNADIDFDIRKTHNAEGKAYAADVIKAMHDAMDANADIINMSFGAKDTFEMGKFFHCV